MKKRVVLAWSGALALGLISPGAASVSPAGPREVPPAWEVSEGQALRAGFLIPLAAAVALIAILLAATDDDEYDFPTSP